MIILVSGLPGSGKTFFAERLAQRIKAIHLSSDRLRKELFPVQRVYSEEEKQSVYQEMLSRMRETVQQRQSVILDATFYRADLREPFVKAAEILQEKMYFICITASEELVRKRTSVQREDSEANYEVYLKLKDHYEPIQSSFLALQSKEDNIEEMLNQALAYLK